MPVEIFYFHDEQHSRDSVEERLKSLAPKSLARCLAQIDLLEAGEPLPAQIDKPAFAQEPSPDYSKKSEKDSDADRSAVELRELTTRSGHDWVHCYYAPLPNGRLAVVEMVEGKTPGKRTLVRIRDRADRAVSSAATPEGGGVLKSHRELVAETTLGDPDAAARYARARERARFALALIRLREMSQHTPESLAERTGLSRKVIVRAERGRLPVLNALRRLADALHAQIVIAPGAGLAIGPAQLEPDKHPDGHDDDGEGGGKAPTVKRIRQRKERGAPPAAAPAGSNGKEMGIGHP